MKKVKITAVNYLNTFPFKYGMEKNPHLLQWAEINYATPSECATMLLKHQTNIALAPVAILAFQPKLKIITNFCLSSNQEVKSVKLYSKKNIHDIHTITLDYQSLSSVSLLKVLMKHYWKKEVQYIQGEKGFEKSLQTDAMVVIGDRTFELNGSYKYEYDLAKEWYNFFGKPFVFAAWISNIMLAENQIQQLNMAFEYGLMHMNEVVQYSLLQTNVLQNIDLRTRENIIADYLNHKMQYYFTPDRYDSVHQFISLLRPIIQEDKII